MTDAEAIGRRLAQLRRKKGLDEERDIEAAEIAEAVGVSDVTYSRYESGKRTPKPVTMQALADYFGVTREFIHYGVSLDAPVGARHGSPSLSRMARVIKEAELAGTNPQSVDSEGHPLPMGVARESERPGLEGVKQQKTPTKRAGAAGRKPNSL